MRTVITLALLLFANSAFGQLGEQQMWWLLAEDHGVSSGGPSSPTPELLWWKMNEGSGTTLNDDSTLGTSDGTTDADWVTGASGSGFALDFNGTTDNATTDASVTFGSGSLSITFWLNPDVTNAADYIILTGSGANQFEVQINPPHLQVSFFGDTGVRRERTTGELVIGEWHHFAIIMDGSTETGDVKIYKDGNELSLTLSANTRTGTSDQAASVVHVGASAGGSFLMDARKDDLRIYDRVITEGEITQIDSDPR